MEINYIDLFSGIGGFHLGLKQAGFSFNYCGYSEIDKYAKQIYNKHFKDAEDLGDVRRIQAGYIVQRVGNIDIITGGFPCQAFSISGKRKGFRDTRGTLFFEICRLAGEIKPKILFLENVRGLLSHDEGCTFETIIRELVNLGYGVEWQSINSKYYGVPQNRERVFIIGHLGGISGRKIFPVRENAELFKEKNNAKKRQTQAPYSSTIRGSNIKADNTFILHNIYGGFKEEHREFKNISPTIRTSKGGGHLPSLFKNGKIRRLTPTECERLQGFPDNWTADLSDNQRYKCLGNAVTVNVIKEIGLKIKKVYSY